MDDLDVVDAIYSEYVSSIGIKMDEADATLAAGAWDALDKVAHTIKGNALAAGDMQMADTAIALRNAAKLQDKDQAGHLIANIKTLAEQL